jgi:hypothetical protein
LILLGAKKTRRAFYYEFSSTAASDEVAPELGTWQTFTVDLGAYSNAYTEFAFVIPKRCTVYFCDMYLT